ncbi:MAG: hypothetical protein K0S32_2346 [Bacteroidetes bacterium]|jgi:hypothetical protein|nr:hypothetical protein [Bacteroidota bacterium]
MDSSVIIKGERKGISNWIRQFATYLDLEKRMYKLQESILGIFKWGAFEPLPKVDYVLIFKQLFAKCEACSVEDYENNDFSFYQVSLVYHKNRKIVVHETRNKAEAFKMGLTIADELQTRLKDSVSIRGKSTWLV